MRHPARLLLPLLLLPFSASSGESRPLTQAESDTLTYIRSVGASPMHEMCKPMTKSMPDFEARLAAWQTDNKDAIERGRQARAAQLEPGKTIEQYEEGVQKSVSALLAKTPPERIAKQCLGFIASIHVKSPD